ncbi:MAG TPA: TRAP transporter substrate-binding protein DctP [Gammaproteobacteria bacterium]|jgi:TRAP-type C4-dicarboxylate transport system substrate-binding protein
MSDSSMNVDKARRALVGALAGTAAAAPWLAGSRVSQAEPIVLRYTSHVPRSHGLFARAFVPFAELVERETEGRLRFAPFTDQLLHDPVDGFKATVTGITDYTHGYVTYQPGSFKLLHATQLPFLFPTPQVASLVVEELHPKYFKAEYERMGVYLAHCDATSPYNIISKRPIRRLEDLRGVKMRVTGGLVTEIFRELGAVPVAIAAAEVYTALQRGIVDAIALSVSDMASYRLQEIGPYYTRIDLNVLLLHYCLNRERFDALPRDLKEQFYRLLRIRSQIAVQNYYSGEGDQRALATLRDGGVEIIELDEEERGRFRAAVAPIRQRYIDTYQSQGLHARELIEEMQALALEYAPLTNAELNERVATRPVLGIIDL